jgi:type VI secretion system protein VasG
MVKDELTTVVNLAENLHGERIVGQDHALEMIAKRIRTSRANLDDPGKPIGVFMLAGRAASARRRPPWRSPRLLYGGEQNMITINMSSSRRRTPSPR